MRAVSEGLPLNWRELSYQDDIIAGEEFLSIFLRSRLQEAQMAVEDRQPSLTTTLETILDSDNDLIEHSSKELLRQSRSTSFLTAPVSQPLTVTPQQFSTVSTTPLQEIRDVDQSSKNSSPKSSSVYTASTNQDSLINTEVAPLSSTEVYGAVVSEERPTIFAEANKSDFSVEEGEPIARTTNVAQEYPSTEATSDSLYSNPPERSVNQQNFVYHNYPGSGDRSRSVSFSSVIQELPQQTVLSSWNIQKPLDGDYKAVTFHSSPKDNNYNAQTGASAVLNLNNTHQRASGTTNIYYNKKSSVADEDNVMVPIIKNNEDNTDQQNSMSPRETTWQVYSSVRPTSRGPVVYGKPEQNYEVDEAVSIMTNGRTHGVQTVKTQDVNPAIPPLTAEKPENNADPNGQKVGYVVEGRNFRKYRVEEKTSDGFIVGEYGVVSHNDGSLRGVRYTADSTINPRVIYDALMKFLSL